jgi:hypothetical protein
MQADRLKEIMLDQKEVFNLHDGLIQRDVDFSSYISTRQVIIITGIRRCGKSSLLYLIKEHMGLEESDYCYFNFDDERVISQADILEKIYNLHLEKYGKEPILFFDEIQNIKNWEKFINRTYERGIKIFVTGSNANLLSSEISTSLTGRNRELKLFPFSFKEYLRFLGRDYEIERLSSTEKSLLQKDFNQYMETGGFPLVIKENDLELINSYFQDILYRDIISRYRLSQVNEIRQIALYFASNNGKIFSYSALQEFSGVKSRSSIKDYLGYYEQSYLFFYLSKFDYSVRKQIMNPKKVYTIDPAISNRLGFNFSENRGRTLENIIFLELLRRGKEVYYSSGKNECDFVIKEGLNINDAIQVCWSLNKTNKNREIAGLKEAMESYGIKKGQIIANEFSDVEEEASVKYIRPWKFLMEEEK